MSQVDTDKMPYQRDERCLNCEGEWGIHEGWKCPSAELRYAGVVEKSRLPADKRYLSTDMVAKEPDPCQKEGCRVCVPASPTLVEEMRRETDTQSFDFDGYNGVRK